MSLKVKSSLAQSVSDNLPTISDSGVAHKSGNSVAIRVSKLMPNLARQPQLVKLIL